MKLGTFLITLSYCLYMASSEEFENVSDKKYTTEPNSF